MVLDSGYASQDALYISTIVLTALAGVIVATRMVTRLLIAKQAGLDDAFIVVAYTFSVLMGVTIWEQTRYGMGKHITDISLDDFSKVALWFWICYWVYYLALCFTKMSILVQYLRVFPYDRLRYVCFALMAIVGVWSCWSVLSGIFMCSPVSVFWHATTLNPPQCLSRQNVWYANAAVNMVTDIAIFVLPLPYINSLEIPRRQKNLLMGVFGVGFFVVLTSIFRLMFIYPITISPDLTYNNPMVNIWSCAEVNIGILCSCAPALKGAIQRGFPKLLDSMRSLTGRSTSRSDSENSIIKEKRSGSGFGSFVASKLASSTKSSNRSLNRSYGSEEPSDVEKGVSVVTSVHHATEVNDGAEFKSQDQYGRDDKTLQGRTETMISAGRS